MPSRSPAEWRADIEATRRTLANNKLLSVSVVGSVQEGWTIDQLADDYAQCARWAVESGADCIETNLSCPNVSTCDGQLYQRPTEAGLVAATVRGKIGDRPYLIKIGHVTEQADAIELLAAVAPYINAIALTNSVATTVRGNDGHMLFDGARRGICGAATRDVSLAQTRLFARLIRDLGLNIRLIGVGGIRTADDVRQYLQAGAEATHVATAAMVDPSVGIAIRHALAEEPVDLPQR
jgi:dihydroorotate dehydrogenase